MSVGTVVDGESTTEQKILALKRALIETVADCGPANISTKSLQLLLVPVDLNFVLQFGGGTTARNGKRTQAGSARSGNSVMAIVENHLADIDKQLVALGGS